MHCGKARLASVYVLAFDSVSVFLCPLTDVGRSLPSGASTVSRQSHLPDGYEMTHQATRGNECVEESANDHFHETSQALPLVGQRHFHPSAVSQETSPQQRQGELPQAHPEFKTQNTPVSNSESGQTFGNEDTHCRTGDDGDPLDPGSSIGLKLPPGNAPAHSEHNVAVGGGEIQTQQRFSSVEEMADVSSSTLHGEKFSSSGFSRNFTFD